MKEQVRHRLRVALSIGHVLVGAALVVFVAVVWITERSGPWLRWLLPFRHSLIG